MSRNGEITLNFADSEARTFRLAIGQLLELQDKCNAGPAEIATRLQDGRWRVEDVTETIRLGLIGGGMSPAEANTLVRRYVHERPLLESIMYAQAIIMSALIGDPKEQVGKKRKAAGKKPGSPPPPSTERVQ